MKKWERGGGGMVGWVEKWQLVNGWKMVVVGYVVNDECGG